MKNPVGRQGVQRRLHAGPGDCSSIVKSPFSPRGRLPFKFPFETEKQAGICRLIPGVLVSWSGGYVRCAYDAIPAVCRILKLPEPPKPELPDGFWAGKEKFLELGFHKILRPYQIAMLRRMGKHDAFLCTDEMRLGKTVSALATAIRRGARRILVICPGYARPVWKKEIVRWLGVDPLLLEGRSGDRGRFASGEWVRGHGEMHCALAETDFHIVNHEIFSAQRSSDARGKMHNRQDLHGVSPILRQHTWDVVLLDEIHELKTPYAASRSRDNRPDLVDQVTGDPRRVIAAWGLTGTPMTGRVWHYYQLVRLVFGRLQLKFGRLGKPLMGTVFGYQARYADGHHERITFRSKEGLQSRQVWKAVGVSCVKEFRSRKKRFSLGRTAQSAGVDLPKIQREVREVELDPKRKTIPVPRKKGTRLTKQQGLAAQTISMKAPIAVKEALRAAAANGEKSAIFVRWKSSHARVLAVLKKERLNKIPGLLVLACTGDDPRDARMAMCERLVEHEGPAIIVSTIEALPGSMSLRGLRTNYFCEWHDKLDKLQQAEARGHEPGTIGVISIYLTVPGTVDERDAERTVDRLNALAEIDDREDAEMFALAIQQEHEKELDELYEILETAKRWKSAAIEDVESDLEA